MAELMKLDNLLRVLNEYGAAVRNKYQDNLIESDRVASGKLLNSVEFHILTDNGKEWEVQLELQDYWKAVEYGTRPHTVPASALYKWITIKPVIPRPDADGKIPTPWQLAYKIQHSIAKHGTKGSHDLEDALSEINAEYLAKMQEAFGEDVEQSLLESLIDIQNGNSV